MRFSVSCAAALCMVLSACGGDPPETTPLAADSTAADRAAINAAVASDTRPESDTQRDAGRQPTAVLELAGIRPGQTVVDFGAAGGYYTRILREAVGQDGRVVAFNPAWLVERFPPLSDATQAMERASALLNQAGQSAPVRVTSSPMDAPDIGPAGSADVVMMVLMYHDAYWNDVNIADMNVAIFQALKPGGRYVVVDHAAEAGAGTRDVEALHRIDPAQPLAEIQAAGFRLVESSPLLANPDDNHTTNVFADLRGQTDRFIYVFERPA